MTDSSPPFFDLNAEALARLLYDEDVPPFDLLDAEVANCLKTANVLDFEVHYQAKKGSIAQCERECRLSNIGLNEPYHYPLEWSENLIRFPLLIRGFYFNVLHLNS